MFIPRLYLSDIHYTEEVILLDKTQSHYLYTVLRSKAGEPIIAFNGEGGEFLCQIDSLSAKMCTLRVQEHIDVSRESPLALHLVQGISRSDRFDYVIQKATELGIKSITPIISDKVQFKMPLERLQKKQAHWEAISISACEQSGRTVLPIIHEPIRFHDWLTRSSFSGASLFCSTNASQPLKEIHSTQSIRLAIGPESGWSQQEEQQLEQAGFIGASLGPRVLRTETAPVVALSILQSQFGDL